MSSPRALRSTMADRIAVLKTGRILGLNETAALIASPAQDYTRALISAAPQLRDRVFGSPAGVKSS